MIFVKSIFCNIILYIFLKNSPGIKMFNWKRNLFFLWLSQFLSSVGFSFATPFIPFYIQALGITDLAERSMWVSFYAASGNLSFCLLAPVWGFLADIYGRKLMVLRANFVSALLVPLMAFVPGVGWLILIRFFVGMFSVTVTASQIIVSSNAPVKNRGIALGILTSAVYGGTVTGTCLGGIIVDSLGYRVSFFISGLTLFLSGLLVLLGVKEEFQKSVSLRERLGDFKFSLPRFGPVWLILLLIMLIGFSNQFDTPFFPMLVAEVNGPEKAATWTGIIASIVAVSGLVSGFILGWLADRISPQKVAVWSALLAGIFMIPQALAPSLGVLIPARFGMVFFAGGLSPVFQIWLAKFTPDDKRGLLFGWASSAKSFGWALSALSGGSIAALMGVRWVYAAAAVMFLLLIPIIRITIRKFENHPGV